VPTLVARLPQLAPEPRRDLARRLLARSERPVVWQSFNVSHARARDVLARNRALLERYAR
jgi:hypothetical protein